MSIMIPFLVPYKGPPHCFVTVFDPHLTVCSNALDFMYVKQVFPSGQGHCTTGLLVSDVDGMLHVPGHCPGGNDGLGDGLGDGEDPFCLGSS